MFLRWLPVALLLLGPLAGAALDDQDTATIQADEYWMYPIELYEEGRGIDDPVPLMVAVTHEQGPPVNFFILDEDNFGRYQREEVFAGIQGERTYDIDGEYATTVKLYEVATYYLVWDNYDYSRGALASGPSTFSYDVQSEDVEEIPGPGMAWAAASVLLAFAVRRHR